MVRSTSSRQRDTFIITYLFAADTRQNSVEGRGHDAEGEHEARFENVRPPGGLVGVVVGGASVQAECLERHGRLLTTRHTHAHRSDFFL